VAKRSPETFNIGPITLVVFVKTIVFGLFRPDSKLKTKKPSFFLALSGSSDGWQNLLFLSFLISGYWCEFVVKNPCDPV